jgi:Na+(H+)/acetate symporter ActP
LQVGEYFYKEMIKIKDETYKTMRIKHIWDKWVVLITDKNRQKPTKTDKKADKYRQKSKQTPTKFLSVFVCLFVGFCCLPF